MEWFNPLTLASSLLYSFLGVFVFWIAFLVLDKVTPVDLWGEIIKNKNLAVALVMASMCLGIAIIIAASIVD